MARTDLQIDWLRTLVAVVDTGSLSAAAPLVHRSQSAVSAHIQKLEAAIGGAVLSRGPRHLELTPTGTELLAYARRVLALQREALAAVHGPLLTGRIKLGVPDDYAASYLTPVLRRFAARHSGVEITLLCEQSTQLIPRTQRGEIDISLVSRDRPSRGTLLFREPLVWAGAAHYEAWKRDPLPIAAYESQSLARRGALAALRAHRQAFRVVYHSSSLAGQLAAVESGLAVAVLTRCSVPASVLILDQTHALPGLPSMEVAVFRSNASRSSSAVDALEQQMLGVLGRTD